MELTKTDLNKTLRVKQQWIERNRHWYKVDATGKTLGKIAVDIANKLQGKHKAHYNDFWDAGDFVVVENIENIQVTGNKLEAKMYHSYSGYKGNVKSINLANLMKKTPDKALWFAVRGMLPKNKLRDSRMKRLKITVGTTDKYNHFKPITLA